MAMENITGKLMMGMNDKCAFVAEQGWVVGNMPACLCGYSERRQGCTRGGKPARTPAPKLHPEGHLPRGNIQRALILPPFYYLISLPMFQRKYILYFVCTRTGPLLLEKKINYD